MRTHCNHLLLTRSVLDVRLLKYSILYLKYVKEYKLLAVITPSKDASIQTQECRHRILRTDYLTCAITIDVVVVSLPVADRMKKMDAYKR